MASMKAASGKAAGQRALASGSVSSLRIKPFTSLAKPVSRASVRARAAAVEAEEDLDFSFSFTDARKNNEYSTSDVEAAIRFYQEGEGSAPVFDADFVSNKLGVEDASFFDDIDNEEAYGDEYIVAGIPEAAPKKRGRARAKDGGQDEEDDLEMAKSLDKVKALEDRMVLEAAMEEEFGDGKRSADADAAETKTGVWDWLTDLNSTDARDAEAIEDTRKAVRASTAILSDGQVTSDIAGAKAELFEDTEVPTYLELFANDDVTEDVLSALNDNDDSEGLTSTITDAELQRLDALLAEELPTLDLKPVGASSVPYLEDVQELDQGVVDRYIEQLRTAMASTSGASDADVKALFGDEPVTIETAGEPESEASKKEYSQLLATPEPKLSPITLDLESQSAAIEDLSADPEDDDDAGLERELLSLQAVEGFGEEDFPTDEAMDGLEGYLVAAEDYVAQEDARNLSIMEAVTRGELSADVLAEELEDMPDAEDEMARELALLDEEDAPDMSMVDEDDGENWTERIIELTRVTKVVKGGKIMGFRCVAIVGNQNGLVGVGCQAGREVAVAVKRTLVDAKRNVVRVPIVGAGTVPHKMEAKYHAARCVVVPASDGTGCIAGGSVRSVLELAGVKNVLAKRIGSRSALNSARATVKALQSMKSLYDVSKTRGVTMEQLMYQP